MDVLYFLKLRMRFIRKFYDEASFPFSERKRKIEGYEEPFIPPHTENGDPPFEIEWIEADESLDILGQMSVSMLHASLDLYLKALVNELRQFHFSDEIGRPDDQVARNKGWLCANQKFFNEKLGVDWNDAPSNLSLLEEIALARNCVQHPEDITSIRIKQSKKDFDKYHHAFFADELDKQIYCNPNLPQDAWIIQPWRLNITKDKLFNAIDEVENFCEWLWERFWPNETQKL